MKNIRHFIRLSMSHFMVHRLSNDTQMQDDLLGDRSVL